MMSCSWDYWKYWLSPLLLIVPMDCVMEIVALTSHSTKITRCVYEKMNRNIIFYTILNKKEYSTDSPPYIACPDCLFFCFLTSVVYMKPFWLRRHEVFYSYSISMSLHWITLEKLQVEISCRICNQPSRCQVFKSKWAEPIVNTYMLTIQCWHYYKLCGFSPLQTQFPTCLFYWVSIQNDKLREYLSPQASEMGLLVHSLHSYVKMHAGYLGLSRAAK